MLKVEAVYMMAYETLLPPTFDASSMPFTIPGDYIPRSGI
jgi:hypothetical protein